MLLVFRRFGEPVGDEVLGSSHLIVTPFASGVLEWSISRREYVSNDPKRPSKAGLTCACHQAWS